MNTTEKKGTLTCQYATRTNKLKDTLEEEE
jgi:hypothetical protein